VASDRTIGGFCHTRGEDQPKVQEKRRMLEEEGVQFEVSSDGKSDKIRKEYFVDTSPPAASASGSSAKKRTLPDSNISSTVKQPKKQRAKHETTDKAESQGNNSATTHLLSEATLKQEILNVLQSRAPGKTC
jgi:hypothetical protein